MKSHLLSFALVLGIMNFTEVRDAVHECEFQQNLPVDSTIGLTEEETKNFNTCMKSLMPRPAAPEKKSNPHDIDEKFVL